MTDLPKISIVVPNFNGAATLGRTLDSILAQEYPSLELIVIDGGSTDDSVDVIRRYASAITHWESERDRGQSHAINKGFAHCSGDVVNWINSDDYLLPGALLSVGRAFAANPRADVVIGGCELAWPLEGRKIVHPAPTQHHLDLMPCWCPVAQPSCFYRRSLLDRDPPLDERLHYAMDFDLWNHFVARGAVWHRVDDVLSVFPYSGQNKSCTGGPKIIADHDLVYRRYVRERVPLTFWYRLIRVPLLRFQRRHPGPLSRLIYRICFRLYRDLLSPVYGRERITVMDRSEWIP